MKHLAREIVVLLVVLCVAAGGALAVGNRGDTLSGRVSRLEAKTRSLQAQVTSLKRADAVLAAGSICGTAIGSDLTVLNMDATDYLWDHDFGSATGPFYGVKSFDDGGACAAIGVKRTPGIVTHSMLPAQPVFAAQRVLLRVALRAVRRP